VANTSNCQECKHGTTLEDYPFAPMNVSIAKNEHTGKIEVTWKPPQRPSGNISKYIIELKGQCIEKDNNCPQKCSSSENKTVFLESNNDNLTFSEILNESVKPFWTYTAKVLAENSFGIGKSTSNQFSTNAEDKLPKNVTINSESKIMTVKITPDCPYTGPANFKIQLFNKGSLVNERKYLNYTAKNEAADLKLSFQNLMPAQSYKVCISLQTLSQCFDTETKQIPPEGYPVIELIEGKDDSFKFYITSPKNAYQFDNENLTYSFEMTSKCLHEENTPKCKTKCLEESMLLFYSIQSDKKSFIYSFNKLTPGWRYKFRSKVKHFF